MSARVIGLIAYGMSFVILLMVFYFYERAKSGRRRPIPVSNRGNWSSV